MTEAARPPVIGCRSTAIDWLLAAGFARSRSEARRLIQQTGLQIDRTTVREPDARIHLHREDEPCR